MVLSFPILKRKIHGRRLVYLDNAATTQKPKEVIDAFSEFYTAHNANINRGVYVLSVEATELWDAARGKVASFIHADHDEIVFTKGATEGINVVARSFESSLRQDDEVIVSMAEHHANFVPWQNLCRKKKAKFIVLPLDKKIGFSVADLKKSFSSRTKVVALTQMSNVLGCETPIRAACSLVKKKYPRTCFLVDGSQGVSHLPVDVRKLGCDFFVFSSHKMLGPFGVGVLYGKKETLASLDPLILGGDMISHVSVKETRFAESPRRFEGGTQNIAGVYAFGVAVDILKKKGMGVVHEELDALGSYAWELLSKVKGVTLFSQKKGNNGIISFNVEGVHPHDVASILDGEGIAIRAGHHCAEPLMHSLGISSSCRASFYVYNTQKDARELAKAVQKAYKVFHGS